MVLVHSVISWDERTQAQMRFRRFKERELSVLVPKPDGVDENVIDAGQWGYHPLVLSLANTGELLYVVNRSGNRPSHEHAAIYFDKGIALCRRAGFRKILLRGDTDFTQTSHLDRWDRHGVEFIFGIDAMPNLHEIVENLPKTAWKMLKRPAKYEVKTQPRRRPENVKEEVVRKREFENIHLAREYVAEFPYQPSKCEKPYRIVVVWKDIEVHKGQQKLFDDSRCFFYITNNSKKSAGEIVYGANDRCNQENTIGQLKSGVRSLAAPVDTLMSNWAYMVMASLAWNLKVWAALMLPEEGRWKKKHAEVKNKLLWMSFCTFRRAILLVPAQVVHAGRTIVCRLLAWNPFQHEFFRLLDQLARPLRC